MKEDAKFYREIASSLIDLKRGGDLPRRYLTLYRRAKALQGLVAEARRLARENNMLAEVKFRAPLSVAGDPRSLVIVRAEGLVNAGIPVCLTLDEKGQHRGTTLEDLTAILEAETGREWGPVEVMNEYQRFMCWHPTTLKAHPEARYRKIPRLQEMLHNEQSVLELRLREYVKSGDSRIFSVAIESSVLESVCAACSGPSVILGYKGEGSTLIVNGHSPAAVLWGCGTGLAVVNLSDLKSLLGKSGDVIVIDLNCGGWDAWTDSAAVVLHAVMDMESPKTRQFEYFREGLHGRS